MEEQAGRYKAKLEELAVRHQRKYVFFPQRFCSQRGEPIRDCRAPPAGSSHTVSHCGAVGGG
jgi:hypothetical protein